jgi:hypothetical protein
VFRTKLSELEIFTTSAVLVDNLNFLSYGFCILARLVLTWEVAIQDQGDTNSDIRIEPSLSRTVVG